MLNVTIQNDGKIKIQSEKFDDSEYLKVCVSKH